MEKHLWIETIGISAMATDSRGDVIDMNQEAVRVFEEDGGLNLMGKNLADCHATESNEIIDRLMQNGETNIYTVGKKGKKKLIYQGPWLLADGNVGGLVELSITLPEHLPHIDRD
jgi:transcriptional regulator with PAS, ATPase and Fis domain